MREAVEAVASLVRGKPGMDLVVNTELASVEDYLGAVERFILSGPFRRERARVQSCQGCDLCCRERVPLTGVDAWQLKEAIDPDLTWTSFFQRYTSVFVAGRSVDISLARDEEERCILLDPQKRLCLFYPVRPLVCRTYLCTPLSPRAKRLRSVVTNTGEDELVRMWLDLTGGDSRFFHEAIDPAVDFRDWPENPWSGKREYDQVFLREIVPVSLWKELVRR